MMIIIHDFVDFECLDFIEGHDDLTESQGVKLIGFFRALEDYMLDFLFFNCNTAELTFTVDSDYRDYHKDKLVISTIGKLYGLDYVGAGLESGHRLDFEFLV